MKKQSILIIAAFSWFLLLTACSGLNEQSAEAYQKELKAFYDNPDTNPLTLSEREHFKGITFYSIEEKYKVKARFVPIIDGEIIEMPTSANKIKRYKPYGTFYFAIDEQELELTGYVSEPVSIDNPNYVFIPFRDASNGKTSYGAGRYLDLEKTDIVQGRVTIDFNKAYNPYCAYSEEYNCPIPPDENTLVIAIEAGVSLENE